MSLKDKVIFMSGGLKAETLESLKRMNVIDILAKPFDIDRIMDNIVKATKNKGL